MNYELNLKRMLRYEVIDKGRSPAIAFGIFAIFVFIYGFTCTKYILIIKSFAAFIVVLSLARLNLMQEINRKGAIGDTDWNLLRINVWLNMISWAVILTTASYELEFNGVHFMVVTTVVCGFTSASLITLSSDMTLFLPFQFFMLMPQILVMSFDALTVNKYGLGPLIPVYLMYLAYQLKQVQDFRSKIIQNYKAQIDLKKTNADLQSSQETQVQQTVKLIHTSRLAALGEMAAGIAHEINNPLAIISGSLQQLDRKIVKEDFSDLEKLKRHTDRSQQAIHRITKIINGLRLFSQQTDALPKVVVSLHEIVDDTLNFCQEMLKARYVKLDIGSIPEVRLECHPVQISQVIINLIKNAEDALQCEENEHEKWVKIVFEIANPEILIHVSNGGPKIPEDIQDRLFLPFFTTKGVGKGTGLGLSISRGIMKEHGGELIFNDSESKTTFTIMHPRSDLE